MWTEVICQSAHSQTHEHKLAAKHKVSFKFCTRYSTTASELSSLNCFNDSLILFFFLFVKPSHVEQQISDQTLSGRLTLFSLKFSSNCQHSSSILSFVPTTLLSSSSSSSSSHPESFGHSQHSPSDGEPLELELDPGSVPESSSPPDKFFLSDFPRSLRFFVHRRGSSRIMTSSSSLNESSSGALLVQVRCEAAEVDGRTMGFDWSILTSTESVFLFMISILICFLCSA